MDFDLTKEQIKIQKTIVDFVRREINPGVAERERAGIFPKDQWDKCAAMRLLALPFPQDFGGDGFDFVTTVTAFHALGYACQDSGLVHALASQLICGIQILLFGNDEQKTQALPDLASGRLIYAQAITEPDSGSDAFAMRTTAVKTTDGYILNGTKTMISNGPIADRVLVFAITDPERKLLGSFSCFLISKGNPGYSAGKPFDKLGLRTLANGELVFDNCQVPSSSVLGKEGQGTILFDEAMEWERTLMSALLLGGLERVLEACISYVKEREAFGKSIGKFQAISHKISAMKMNVELGKLILYRAALLKSRRKRATLETSIAKLFTSESLKQACLDAVQIHGSYGYTTEFDVERELRDSIASTIYSGSSEMQRNIIARLVGL